MSLGVPSARRPQVLGLSSASPECPRVCCRLGTYHHHLESAASSVTIRRGLAGKAACGDDQICDQAGLG
jgi:hypothetical protein